MICIRMMGGLGNQMYQYALGRKLSMLVSAPFEMEMAWFKYSGKRQYALDKFRITGARENWLMGDAWKQFLAEKFPNGQMKDKEQGFDPDVFEMAKSVQNLYLRGYWQSYRYFEDIRAHLLEEFTLQAPITPHSERWKEDIARHEQSVFLHIRRGDYVDEVGKTVYVELPPSYYEEGVRRLAESFEGLTAYVFSNDLPWAKRHLQLSVPTKFVEGNDEEHGYEDLALMRACKHHIIANSTFSWWGAWLSEKGGWTFAPGKWYQEHTVTFHPESTYPEAWKILGFTDGCDKNKDHEKYLPA